MKLLALAALLAVLPQIGAAQTAAAPVSEALVDRFLAALPDKEEIQTRNTEIDPAELEGLVALNPGKEAQVRAILQSNLACSGAAVSDGTLRMLRTIARNLGETKVKQLIDFYEGSDFTAFTTLATRMEGNASPSAADEAAMAKLMEAYPLRAYYEELGQASEIISADEDFMTAATQCASEQVDALERAGLRPR